MKPAWDQLSDEFANSKTVIVADVDCTGAGEPLCSRFGIEGFPTIKSFSPPDTEGESYEGGREYDELLSFASTLGPGCSAGTKENCSADQLAELEKLLQSPVAELESELAGLKEKLDTASSEHDELLKSLQAQYEASEEALGKLKKDIAPRMKALRGALAKPAGANKDEV